MKTTVTKPGAQIGSARRLTLCRQPTSPAQNLPCENGTVLAGELLNHLHRLIENSDDCHQLTGIALGCQRGGWESGKLGPGNVLQAVGVEAPDGVLALVRVSFEEPAETSSGSAAQTMAELGAAISGIFKIVLRQCHQTHALRDSEDLHKVILHAISDVAVLTDESGVITYVCPNADGFCGRSLEEVKKFRTIFEILGPDSACFETMRTGQPWRDLKIKLIAKDGSEVTMLVDTIKTSLPQGPFLFTFRNITELTRSQERLAEANVRLQASTDTLAEKNIALKELLYQVGRECDSIVSNLKANVDTNILPLIDVLERDAQPSLQPVLSTLKEALHSMLSARDPKRRQTVNLTPRELQVCNMVSSGYSSKQIASALNVAPATVVNTRKRIRRKLGISGDTQNLATHWRAVQY